MEKIEFYAYGHEAIKATHKSTLEITKDPFLTERGDCIIGIRSSMACNDLPNNMKNLIKSNDARVILVIDVDGFREYIFGYGSEKLTLKSDTSMVIRKSTYIDDRTLMIRANKSARDISRKLVNSIKNNNKKISFRLIVI